ncbi:Gfo/Idh/MocA family protein [Microbacterium sp. ASV49]|uniref:Gfo/Idh/MocA family oxidoreductase n=1 Tax=Microbacterium candidum TaxID=3041922 RepID=A0ABT7N0H1_9MICO|nr:Gfo/Idh/MocA family oxidoreductase [Microbacterium sp. ASV49]MDL9980203.1 Gfo/Idh/MocA family oxidoreductase [Microbacterium sp. ASV49]
MTSGHAVAVAVFGAGRMARAHATAWAALGVPVRWIVSPRRRQELWDDAELGLGSARWTDDPAEALADADVTIASICTPTPTHRLLAEQALRAGRHVLLEKPIALTLEDALALQTVADEAPGILMVAHVVRFFAGYAELADRIAAGAVGRPRAVQAHRLSAAPEGADWLHDEERSGGVLVDFAIHDLDQANAVLGRPIAVTSIAAGGVGTGFDGAISTTVEYADGGVAQVLSAVDLPAGTPFRTGFTVVGTDGVDAAAGADGDPFVAQAAYFLACVESGAAPRRAPVSAAVAALRLALAARESLHSGRRVELS